MQAPHSMHRPYSSPISSFEVSQLKTFVGQINVQGLSGHLFLHLPLFFIFIWDSLSTFTLVIDNGSYMLISSNYNIPQSLIPAIKSLIVFRGFCFLFIILIIRSVLSGAVELSSVKYS